MSEGIKNSLILMSIIFLSQLYWTQEDEDFQNHYTSNYRQLCYDACRKRGKNYYWCNTEKGWDYCSLKENIDYKGNECEDAHPCDLHGKDYYWCYTKTGSWGYCGKMEPKKVKHKHLYKGSYYLRECKSKCSNDNSESYYRCYTDEGWDYCSPSPDVTYKNEPCRSDHPCATHDYGYSWCKTDSGWDYCGIFEDIGICATVTRQKRESVHIGEICFLDHFNRKMTKLKPKWDPEAIADGRKYIKEMSHIIAKWNNSYLQEDSKSNVIITNNLRLDLQGLVLRDNLPYYGLQIEMKTHRDEHKSSTVAEVFLPQNVIPERHVQMAIIESFCNRARVFVTLSTSSGSEDNCVLIPSEDVD
ncbi:uncharacterized protein LOC113635554 [Tachysurus fulvidraco]|uniref:uncharacterized protein LOC113635554 n=1 Tax=Tachysurus fulvidraco TaxID=1234273 RepID=UPI001FEE3C29|nr:uncharacterized protein LOC113635554 [Tachysurus fulvidraco]XP_026990853.2 uncharacterized protein LOC113635554 [Tachysurus fulvidraco]XP_047672653.1 uncharacterized protein LOC113635554 [Tachysurus fulvidraco]